MSTSVSDYLLFIFAQYTLGPVAGGMVYLPYQTLYQITSPHAYHESSVRHAINNLSKRGFLEKMARDSQNFMSFTSTGRSYFRNRFKLSKKSLLPKSVHSPSKDNGWWQVVFDVPESNREIRDQIRNKLLDSGFQLWQRSVYLTPAQNQQDDRINGLLNNPDWAPYISVMRITEIRHHGNKILDFEDLWREPDFNQQLDTYRKTALSVIRLLTKSAINKYQRQSAIKRGQLCALGLYNLWHDLVKLPYVNENYRKTIEITVSTFNQLLGTLVSIEPDSR